MKDLSHLGIKGKLSGIGSRIKSRFKRKKENKKVKEEEQPGGKPSIPPTYWSESGGGFGSRFGGGGSIWKVIGIIILLVVIGIVGWYIWNVSGAGQATSGGLFSVQYGFSKFIGSSGVRAFWWQITHPFEVQPTQAKEENMNPKYQFVKSLRESLSVDVSVSPLQMEYGQKAGYINIRINNKGTQDIKKFYLLVLPWPDNHIIHCLGPGIRNSNVDPEGTGAAVECDSNEPLSLFDKDICGEYKGVYNENGTDYFIAKVYNTPVIAGGSTVVSLSNVYVDNSGECTSGKKPWVPTAYPFFVRVITPYVAASRLPLTFLNSDYASLLYRQGNLKQSKVAATAMAGTAVKINIDAGLQPIIWNDKTSSPLPIIFNFENMGSGKLIGSPQMVLIIPKELGTCGEKYFVCGDNATNMIEEFNNTYYPLLSSFAKKEINWIADQSKSSSEYNLCITNVTHEFQSYSCTLEPTIDFKGQKRMTYFITAFAVYNYEAEAMGQVKAYTIGTAGGS